MTLATVDKTLDKVQKSLALSLASMCCDDARFLGVEVVELCVALRELDGHAPLHKGRGGGARTRWSEYYHYIRVAAGVAPALNHHHHFS